MINFNAELNLLSNWYAYKEFNALLRVMRHEPIMIHNENIINVHDSVTISNQAINLYQSSNLIQNVSPTTVTSPPESSHGSKHVAKPEFNHAVQAYKKQPVSQGHHVNHKI
jgi:hypothetical protein